MSFPYFPKQEPIKSIFKQTSEDEDQKLEGSPEFTVLMKGYRTRSCIYERILPDNVSSALRINGPRGSNGCMIYNQLGQIKIKTGLKTKQAGSGLFGLKTSGQQQLHHGRSNIQYNAGGKEDEGQALNVLAYGDVVEESVGGTRYIKATKILIRATDTLVLRGNNVNIEAQGEYSVAAGQIVTGTINDKEIITGQKMTFGAPEETSMKFDPRAQYNIISPGNINHKILGDYKLKSFGCISLFALGGFGTLVKNRSVGMSISTRTKFAAGGTAESRLVSSGKVIVNSVVNTEIGSNGSVDVIGDVDTLIGSSGQVEIDAPKVDVGSDITTNTTTLKGINVDIEGTTVDIQADTTAKLKGGVEATVEAPKVYIKGSTAIYLN